MWAIKDRSDSPLNSPPGRQERFIGGTYYHTRATRQYGRPVGSHVVTNITGPLLFRIRREARAFIDETFGYIRNRKDLKSPPHCWHIPQAVQVTVTVTERGHEKRPDAISQSYA